MARNRTSFGQPGAAKEVPKRGSGKRTMMLDALKANSHDEKSFYELIVQRALDSKDPSSGSLMREIINRLYPPSKATAPLIEFDLTTTDPVKQIEQVLKSVSSGLLPADVGQMIVGMIKDKLSVIELTELAERLERLEKLIAERNG